MSYRIGDLTVQGNPPTNVIELVFGRKTTDGGKARIQARRLARSEGSCGLSMLRADVVDPSPCDYVAPAWDPA